MSTEIVDAGAGRQVPDSGLGRDVLEAAFPPIAIPTSPPRGRWTRRGALGRLLGLGAGAVVVTALPAPVEAVLVEPVPLAPPAQPTIIRGRLGRHVLAAALTLDGDLGAVVSSDVPEIMTRLVADHTIAHMVAEGRPARLCRRDECGEAFGLPPIRPPSDPELAALLDRLDVALPKIPPSVGTAYRNLIDGVVDAIEVLAGLRPARPSSQPVPTIRLVREERIVTMQFAALDRNTRRRVRRWLARRTRRSDGFEGEIIRYRLGARTHLDERGFDFLDIATPTRGRVHSGQSPQEYAEGVLGELVAAISRPGAEPAIPSGWPVCSHTARYPAWAMHADREGRPVWE